MYVRRMRRSSVQRGHGGVEADVIAERREEEVIVYLGVKTGVGNRWRI